MQPLQSVDHGDCRVVCGVMDAGSDHARLEAVGLVLGPFIGYLDDCPHTALVRGADHIMEWCGVGVKVRTDFLFGTGTGDGKDSDAGTYLVHEELFETLNKWTVALWGDRVFYSFHLHDSMPHIILTIDGYEDMHRIWLEDDELDLDRIIAAVIHMYTWIP